MYLMFTGQLPFIGKTSAELGRLHRKAIPIPPREINTFLTPQLDKVILKVLAKEPSARYRTADQLGRVLMTIRDRQTKTPEKTTQPDPAPSKPVRRVVRKPKVKGKTEIKKELSETDLRPRGPDAPGPVDLVAVGLGMAALLFWGGLIPFFYWVYNQIM
jgi:serine/threonine-protein kinase